jgi:hypothetical protein
MRTRSFSASRVSSRPGVRPLLKVCEPARVLPCCSIWARLNSSERSGGSSRPYACATPLPRWPAQKSSKFPKIVMLAFKPVSFLEAGSQPTRSLPGPRSRARPLLRWFERRLS